MGVDAVGEVAGDGGGFGDDGFGDHFPGSGSNDADAEDAFGLGIEDHLGEAVGTS